MRMILGLSALALVTAAPAVAQPQYRAPHGSYERQCANIQMNGQFLSATCRGAQGGGQSSINILSCASDISVDASGALTCAGPGAAPPPPAVRYAAPRGYGPAPGAGPGPVYDRGAQYGARDRGYGPGPGAVPGPAYDRGAQYGAGDRRYGRPSINLYSARNWRSQPVRLEGAVPNLDVVGLNDRVRSIQLERGSGAWIVCTDANYRGRCATIDKDVADTRDIGMRDAISSLRPAY